jgi:dolichyl-phosphate-mannose-protein mannosyltransferase
MNTAPSNKPWREIAAVLALTLVAATLRFWHWGSLGLSHFDEGMYAISGLWIERPGGIESLDPQVVPYSPPGFPILVGLAYSVFGSTDLAAIGVSQLLGVLTIPLVAWIGWRSFGPGAGAASAALAAVSGAHVAFSRMALTDVSFVFFWLVALGLGGRFLERPALGRALVLGLAVGVAQNFKYNGALTGVVVAFAAISRFHVVSAKWWAETVRIACWLLLAAVVATVLYSPWFLFVESQRGGYSGLLQHHRGYLKSVSAWVPNWRLQIGQAVALSGGMGWGVAASVLAWLGGTLSVRNAGAERPLQTFSNRWVLGLVACATAMGTIFSSPWWIGLCCVPWLTRDRRPAVRVLAMSWILLSVLTPFYHPYARLWLPLHAAGWILLGGLVGEALRLTRGDPLQMSGSPPGFSLKDRLLVTTLVVGLVLAAVGEHGATQRPRPLPGLLKPSNSLRIAVTQMETTVPASVRNLRVLARPPVLFYLQKVDRLHLEPFARSHDLLPGDFETTWALVEEMQLQQEGNTDNLLAQLRGHWEASTTWLEDQSLPALLDRDPGAVFRGASRYERQKLWLFRPKRGRP